MGNLFYELQKKYLQIRHLLDLGDTKFKNICSHKLVAFNPALHGLIDGTNESNGYPYKHKFTGE